MSSFEDWKRRQKEPKPNKPGVYDARTVTLKFAGKSIGVDGFDAFVGQFTPDEPDKPDRDYEVIGWLRNLVELVGELPARNVTPGIVEVLECSRKWLEENDDFEDYVGG